MRRGFLALLLVSSMVLAGCFGDGETIVDSDVTASASMGRLHAHRRENT